MAAREGLIGLAFVNAGRFGRQISPFGGIDGRISTNPIAFSAPRRDGEPVLVDLTTSVVAEGKVRVAANKGVQVPEGWLIDHEGNSTTDPTVIKGPPPNGAILPMGGIVAHKGYSLGLLVEILGGTLSGQGCAQGEQIVESNGVLFTVYDISFFTDLDWYFEEVEGMIRHVKASRTAPGFDEILMPGEPEFRLAEARRRAREMMARIRAGGNPAEARRRARGSGGRVWQGFVKRREIEHDAGVSELVLETVDRVRSLGGTVVSVRLEAELKGEVARSASAAVKRGQDPATARRRAARALGMPVDEAGACCFPDALVEVRDAGGAVSTLALELVTGSYSRRQVERKMRMGMVLASHGARLAGLARSILSGDFGGRVRRAWRPGTELEERLFDIMR
jgi:hypothetical protein